MTTTAILPKEVTECENLFMASYDYYDGMEVIRQLGLQRVKEEHVCTKNEDGTRSIRFSTNDTYAGTHYMVCCGDVCVKSYNINLWPDAPLRHI